MIQCERGLKPNIGKSKIAIPDSFFAVVKNYENPYLSTGQVFGSKRFATKIILRRHEILSGIVKAKPPCLTYEPC